MIELRNCPRVATPCQTIPQFASGQKRAFCGLCQRHVHNLSAMTALEQAQLLQREATPCVRYRLVAPALAALLLAGAPALAQDDTGEEEQELDQIVITGGAARVSVPMFIQSELTETFDEPDSAAVQAKPAGQGAPDGSEQLP